MIQNYWLLDYLIGFLHGPIDDVGDGLDLQADPGARTRETPGQKSTSKRAFLQRVVWREEETSSVSSRSLNRFRDNQFPRNIPSNDSSSTMISSNDIYSSSVVPPNRQFIPCDSCSLDNSCFIFLLSFLLA